MVLWELLVQLGKTGLLAHKNWETEVLYVGERCEVWMMVLMGERKAGPAAKRKEQGLWQSVVQERDVDG